MSVTSQATALILSATIAKTINNIDVLSISNSGGEVLRKEPQAVDVISATKTKFTFYLTEAEANTTITKFSLYGESATKTLGTGTELVTQTVSIVKTNTQSLLIYWTLEVI